MGRGGFFGGDGDEDGGVNLGVAELPSRWLIGGFGGVLVRPEPGCEAFELICGSWRRGREGCKGCETEDCESHVGGVVTDVGYDVASWARRGRKKRRDRPTARMYIRACVLCRRSAMGSKAQAGSGLLCPLICIWAAVPAQGWEMVGAG